MHDLMVRDLVWSGNHLDCGCRVADEALAEAYASGYKRGLADARQQKSSIICICCGNVMGPSTPHDETRCAECRRSHA